MLFRFAAAACAFSCAAVYADSQIIDTANAVKTGDIIDTASKGQEFTSLEVNEKTTVASCIFDNAADSKFTAITDGEFEGLKPGMRTLTTHALKSGHTWCDYEYITNEVDIKQQFLEELLTVEMPKMINDLLPGRNNLG